MAPKSRILSGEAFAFERALGRGQGDFVSFTSGLGGSATRLTGKRRRVIDLFPEAKAISDQLLAKRRTMGWSIRDAAAELGVDPGTWGNWERGRMILYRAHRVLIARLLGLAECEVDQQMSAGPLGQFDAATLP
jgi:ribosome-binding protein aMBF1 (putative translation factor)